MKKMFFTCAMLFAFVSAKANDNVVDKEYAANSVKKEIAVEPMGKVAEVTFMPMCWGLSCGTVCDWGEDASDYYSQYDIEEVYDSYEAAVCG